MAKAFDSIAKGLYEAIDFNKGNALAVRKQRPEEIDVAKNTDQYVSSDQMLKRLDESLAKARAKHAVSNQ